jgi:hypothetical protein
LRACGTIFPWKYLQLALVILQSGSPFTGDLFLNNNIENGMNPGIATQYNEKFFIILLNGFHFTFLCLHTKAVR